MHIGPAIEKIAGEWLGKHGVVAVYEDAEKPMTIVLRVDIIRDGVSYPTKFKRYTVVVEEGNLNFIAEGRSRYLVSR